MFEIEIKSLLGSRERADELKRRLVQLFPALKQLPPHKQRNHYFNVASPTFDFPRFDLRSGKRSNLNPRNQKREIAATIRQRRTAHADNTHGDLAAFAKAVQHLLAPEKQEELSHILRKVKGGASIRTRDADGKVFVILKASIGDDSSANGVSRIEFEEPVKLTLEELDAKLLNAGLSYQAKWSREREHYDLGSIHITVDRNAGYGYLAEFEKMIDDGREAEYAKQELKALMAELKCQELAQDRLERMFTFYNEHWEEYYGTDKVFVVE